MNSKRDFLLWYLFGAIFVGVFLLPVLRPAWFDKPIVHTPAAATAVAAALVAVVPVATWLAFAGEPLSRRGRIGATFIVLAATALCEVVHYWVTDRGHYFPPSQFADNTAWQLFMHKPILGLEYPALPHSYRFFPDAIVQFFTWLCGDFVVARIAYRLVFNALLFVSVYRLARTYVTELFAGAAVAIMVVLYPISILKYAGQFVDPMANCAYLACLAYAVRRYEPGFGPTLFSGVMAKESVIIAAVCRAFFGQPRRRALLAAAGYCVVGGAILLAIRFIVNRGHLGYGAISGVGLRHVPENLAGYHEWILMYIASFGSILPGAIFGWRYMDRGFQWTAVTVVTTTIVSSVLFSWMSEVRNMTPAYAVLAVVNVVYLERTFAPRLRSAQPPAASATLR